MGAVNDDPVCAKRGYPSIKAVRWAHRRASWRVRAYWCADCHAYHATNHEKHRDDTYDEPSSSRR